MTSVSSRRSRESELVGNEQELGDAKEEIWGFSTRIRFGEGSGNNPHNEKIRRDARALLEVSWGRYLDSVRKCETKIDPSVEEMYLKARGY